MVRLLACVVLATFLPFGHWFGGPACLAKTKGRRSLVRWPLHIVAPNRTGLLLCSTLERVGMRWCAAVGRLLEGVRVHKAACLPVYDHPGACLALVSGSVVAKPLQHALRSLPGD